MSRQRSPTHPASRSPRPSRRIHEEPPGKLREIASCPRCSASYRGGRWTWQAAPADAYAYLCPACERIESDYPAGVLRLEGAFLAEHRDELIGLLRNVEQRERDEHPLKRIMAVSEEGSGIRVTLTDARLARSLGRALEKAYEGRLEEPGTTGDPENRVEVRWSRD